MCVYHTVIKRRRLLSRQRVVGRRHVEHLVAPAEGQEHRAYPVVHLLQVLHEAAVLLHAHGLRCKKRNDEKKNGCAICV